MAESEYKGMSMLKHVMSQMMPSPDAWGAYKDKPYTWFYLCHKRPGDFGLDLVTYGGRNPKYFPPSGSWEETFSKGLQWTFDMEEKTQGPDEDMRRLRDEVMTKVVPRLLRPLETEGMKIIPTLVHGNLWDGNASVDETGRLVIFDATPLYAHHEYEMAPWWASRHRMGRTYIDEYIKYPSRVSKPEEDFED
ncbi:Fructosamine/Ketosamine-3-kinase [Apiospora saccharicola]